MVPVASAHRADRVKLIAQSLADLDHQYPIVFGEALHS